MHVDGTDSIGHSSMQFDWGHRNAQVWHRKSGRCRPTENWLAVSPLHRKCSLSSTILVVVPLNEKTRPSLTRLVSLKRCRVCSAPQCSRCTSTLHIIPLLWP